MLLTAKKLQEASKPDTFEQSFKKIKEYMLTPYFEIQLKEEAARKNTYTGLIYDLFTPNAKESPNAAAETLNTIKKMQAALYQDPEVRAMLDKRGPIEDSRIQIVQEIFSGLLEPRPYHYSLVFTWKPYKALIDIKNKILSATLDQSPLEIDHVLNPSTSKVGRIEQQFNMDQLVFFLKQDPEISAKIGDRNFRMEMQKPSLFGTTEKLSLYLDPPRLENSINADQPKRSGFGFW